MAAEGWTECKKEDFPLVMKRGERQHEKGQLLPASGKSKGPKASRGDQLCGHLGFSTRRLMLDY